MTKAPRFVKENISIKTKVSPSRLHHLQTDSGSKHSDRREQRVKVTGAALIGGKFGALRSDWWNQGSAEETETNIHKALYFTSYPLVKDKQTAELF